MNKKALISFNNLVKAHFVERKNRFLASVEVMENNRKRSVLAHVHDSGRLEELLYKGNSLLIRFVRNQTRKTAWEVVFANNNGKWILINTIFHNTIAKNIIEYGYIEAFKNVKKIESEITYDNSRFDFLLHMNGEKCWVEVKGCTLVKHGIALFPDAITKRGTKHLEELKKIVENGGKAAVLFLVFNNEAHKFKPNKSNDPDFAKAFYEAKKKGVKIFIARLNFDGKSLFFDKLI